MHFTVAFDRSDYDEAGTGPVKVGWFLNDDNKPGVVFTPPERVRSVEMSKSHAKSASRCPAVINLESRYFLIRCPFDLHLQFVRSPEGKPLVRNALGEKSPVRAKKLSEHLHVVGEPEWRYKDRPTIQISLPYVFVADEPVFLSQVAPFMHYRPQPLPGTIFGGRFPINVWPRPLMWAFEWHEPSKDIILQRGEPLFYAQFETEPADRPVQVFEAEKTPELREYLAHIGGAVNYVNQTFSLFKEAEAHRPARLVKAREIAGKP
ncbi:MAG: hypothetical protein KDJ86_17565 [Bauldia sp.]|uniref:hypothetical protein n=1 Tax=Bauldia sp. TaxID=2575872 RepID=UPI001DFAFD32|nr:hypothetical protein [Bauldia sp.]MCB1497593.1 hypothetical protein [Bauldia sp.]